MLHSQKPEPSAFWAISQSLDTNLRTIAWSHGNISFLSVRKKEHYQGQDYLTFKYNENRLAFVLCDGVSSSYSGGFASSFIGDALIKWAWYSSPPIEKSAFENSLRKYLSSLVDQAQLLEGLIRPKKELTPTQLRIEERLKTSTGSESTFVLFVIDYAQPHNRPWLATSWLGDTRIQIKHGSNWEAFNSWDDRNRWSTIKGIVGNLFTWSDYLPNPGRILAYTDGLSALDENLDHWEFNSPFVRSSFISRLVESNKSDPQRNDDITLIDIALRPRLGLFRFLPWLLQRWKKA